ncbi:bola protein [Morchella snyderi]|nr:bola protein [Morchella snyderi]
MFRRSSSATVRNFSYARPLFNSTQQQHHHHRLQQHLLPLNNRNVGTGPAGILAREGAASPQSPHSSYFSTTSASRSPALVPPDHLKPKELHIFNKLVTELSPSKLEVQDVSGGCGSMYAIEIASRSFKGLPVVKQHRLVQEVLSEEIKGWHGVQLRTKVE